MPYKCLVPGCRSNYDFVRGRPSVQMFKIPSNPPELMNAWLRAINRPNFVPTKHSHVCIKHFVPSDILLKDVFYKFQSKDGPSGPLRVSSAKLKPFAVPSKFQHYTGDTKVEFKPEMWEAQYGQGSGIKFKKRRGRPRKNLISDENVNRNNANVICSSGIFSENIACCALACPNTSDTHVMNHLPNSSIQRDLWIKKIDRLSWVPDVDSALCEIHFEPDMWDYNLGKEKSLKPEAIPTLCLHGEAIKSWVTLDDTNQVDRLDILNQGKREDEEEGFSEAGDKATDGSPCSGDQMFIKSEALEPEIDMVEGNGEQFETVYCDTTFPEQADSIKSETSMHDTENEDLENPLSPETIYLDDQSESNLSANSHEDEGKLKVNICDVKSLQGVATDDQVEYDASLPHQISMEWQKLKRRRMSSQMTKEFECAICERRLSRKRNLEMHIQKLHPNAELSDIKKRNKKVKNGDEKESRPIQILPRTPSPLMKVVQPSPSVLETPPVFTLPRPLDPSPAGGEVKKQFVLLVPSHVPEQPPPNNNEDVLFSVKVASVPLEKRLALRTKLKELVDAVVYKKLDPERIIIAYDGT